MYSQTVLNKHIERMVMTKEVARRPKLYSIEYSQHVTAHLETLYDRNENKLVRPLSDEELGFINNEMLISKLHYPYWAERYSKVIDFSKQLVSFKHNKAQRFFLSILAEMEDAQDPIMIQLLKLRQLGMSSITQRAIAHRNLFYANTDTLVASNDPDKTRKLVEDNIGLTYTNLPWWQIPDIGKKDTNFLRIYDSGEVYCYFTKSNSAITIQHGTMKSGLARGSTPICAHLTELPDFDDPKSLIEGSLLNAMHEDPMLLVVLESTAAGNEGWWPEFYEVNKRLWPERQTRFRPLFIPWYLGDDIWPTQGWLSPQRKRQMLTYKPSKEALAHARRAREYVHSTPKLMEVLGSDWEMPKHQLMFWDYSRKYAIETNNIKVWLQEVGAADDKECFQSAGTSIFPYELIEEYKNSIQAPKEVYVIESPNIPNHLTIIPRHSQSSKAPIEIVKSHNSVDFRATLRPHIYSTDLHPNGKLLLWEEPLKGYSYTISYDDSEGLGKDSTAIEVIRNASWNRPAEQVAEWAASNYNAYDAWPVMLAICEYYSQTNTDPNSLGALACIEMAVNGKTVQEEMMKRGYNRFYYRVNTTATKQTVAGYGWKTSIATRKILFTTLIKAVKDGWLTLNSVELIKELETLEINETLRTIRVEASRRYHDDRCMALAIALVCSLDSIYPDSQLTAIERLENMKRSSALSDSISPSEISTSSGLISFGTQLILPTEPSDLFKPDSSGNSWN